MFVGTPPQKVNCILSTQTQYLWLLTENKSQFEYSVENSLTSIQKETHHYSQNDYFSFIQEDSQDVLGILV